MKILLDQGLPRSVANVLKHAGYATTHVGDIGMSTATDREIIAFAKERGETIVTLDADFHALLALSGARDPSVIRLRVEGKKATDVGRIILEILKVYQPELEKGAVVTANDSRARLRRLPLI